MGNATASGMVTPEGFALLAGAAINEKTSEKSLSKGAVALRRGRIEQADGGTLFLDDVSELPPELQIRILHLLQERSFERLALEQPELAKRLADIIAAEEAGEQGATTESARH